LLGLLPMWMFPRQESLYPGVIYLIGSLILTATASLYARVSLVQVRFFWVLGLSMLAFVTALEAARDLAELPRTLAVAGGIASLAAGVLLLIALFYSQRETPRLPSFARELIDSTNGVLSSSVLQALTPSLEAISVAKPITLLILHTQPDQSGSAILQLVRQPDLVFQLRPDHYLVALQGSTTEGASIAFRRIRENLDVQAYAILPLQGSSLKDVLRQLEGELEHFYLTQSPT